MVVGKQIRKGIHIYTITTIITDAHNSVCSCLSCRRARCVCVCFDYLDKEGNVHKIFTQKHTHTLAHYLWLFLVLCIVCDKKHRAERFKKKNNLTSWIEFIVWGKQVDNETQHHKTLETPHTRTHLNERKLHILSLKTIYSWVFKKSKKKKEDTNLSKGIQGAHGYFSLYFSIKFKICLFVIVSHISCLSLFLSLSSGCRAIFTLNIMYLRSDFFLCGISLYPKSKLIKLKN